MIILQFISPVNNDSLQIGDIAYFIPDPSTLGGFNTSINQSTGVDQSPTFIGPVEAFTETTITIDETNGIVPASNDFIMFAKDSKINLSGVVGYFAEIKIKNNSTEKAEMYSIASEVTISSK